MSEGEIKILERLDRIDERLDAFAKIQAETLYLIHSLGERIEGRLDQMDTRIRKLEQAPA